MGIESLVIRLSGGAANADPTVSTGGAKSSQEVLSQTVTPVTPISGVTIHNAAGNVQAAGTIFYRASTKALSWTPPGDVLAGLPVGINTNGRYLIRGATVSSGYLIVDVVAGSLGNADITTSATVVDGVALFLPAVSKDDALAGITQYYLYYVENPGAATLKSVSVGVLTDTPGADTLSLAVIATKNTTELLAAAAGHSYSAVGINVAMGDMLTTDYWGFWIKRVVPIGTVSAVPNNTFRVVITALT